MAISFKAPCAKLTGIENLWFQLSRVSCNLKCRHCYLDCHQETRKRNFLNTDKITEALKMNYHELHMIYLTGGEPFVHPQIIEIIKYCLTKSNVTICSNGTLINEKKVKILKATEEMTNHKLSFRLSLDHYMEGRNDEYRGTGVFKKVINALKVLDKYGFETSLTCVNLKNEPEEEIRKGFEAMFEKYGLNIKNENLKVVPLLKIGNYAKYYNISEKETNVSYCDLENFDLNKLDCKSSRVITTDGVYCCPALVNDPRGRLGEKLEDAEKNVYLETQTCCDCIKRTDKLFG